MAVGRCQGLKSKCVPLLAGSKYETKETTGYLILF